jgi:hypothetical protein
LSTNNVNLKPSAKFDSYLQQEESPSKEPSAA